MPTGIHSALHPVSVARLHFSDVRARAPQEFFKRNTRVKPTAANPSESSKTIVFIGNLVDVTGIEPVTPCLQSKLGENTKCFVWCRLHGKPARFPLFRMSRSCTERSRERNSIRKWKILERRTNPTVFVPDGLDQSDFGALKTGGALVPAERVVVHMIPFGCMPDGIIWFARKIPFTSAFPEIGAGRLLH